MRIVRLLMSASCTVVRGGGRLGAAVALVLPGAMSPAFFGLNVPGLERPVFARHAALDRNLLGPLPGQGGAIHAVRLAVGIGTLVAVALLLRHVRHGQDWITSAGWATLVVVVSLAWEMPWYVLWVLPFAALRRSALLRRAAVVPSAYLLIALAPITGWLLVHAWHCRPSDTKPGKRHDV